MKIYLIRHGESTSDVKQKYDGDYDDHLTDKGISEAEAIATKLLHSQVEIIFSSAKIRAIETAEILKNSLNCEMVIKEDLNEQDIYGAFPDLSKDQSEEEYRRLGEIIADHELELGGVERYSNFKNRVIECFSEITKKDYKVVAIISHGGPIRCIWRDVLKLGELKQIANGAIFEIEKNNLDFKIIKFN